MSRTIVLAIGNERCTVTVDANGRVSLDGSDAGTVGPAGPGRWLVRSDQSQTVVHTAVQAGTCWVFVDGRTWELAISRGTPGPRRKGGADPLVAPMPATVSRLLTAEGRTVRRGDILIVLEAMKMEHALRAPQDGRVRALRCAEGERVEPGAALVEIEPGEGGP